MIECHPGQGEGLCGAKGNVVPGGHPGLFEFDAGMNARYLGHYHSKGLRQLMLPVGELG